MPRIHTSVALPLDTYRNDKRLVSPDLLLDSQNFVSSHPAVGSREPVAVLVPLLPEARGSRNRRALILGWAYYLDAFSDYPLRTWLPK
ncbi:hypothetical protein IFM89_003150 [Coptis chinensis]|uniref:Uncharacterized protein n=1 Tax=Coptis chinensis TaxID=261450 RepID=A0A835I6W3_9MAGN|nr:hypothetical protein IFM89_003150 [Coptis chinensis]